jgi:hypothetical protein
MMTGGFGERGTALVVRGIWRYVERWITVTETRGILIFHPKWFERCIEFFKPLQFIPGKVEYQWEGFTIRLQERLVP